MAKTCCVHCFADKHIQQFIQDLNGIGDCDYCGATQAHVGLTSEVGEFIRDCLKKAYQDVDSACIPYESAEGGYLAGTDVIDILLDDMGILSGDPADKGYDLLSDLLTDSGPSPWDVQDGANDWLLGGEALLVERGFWSEDNVELTSWEQFKLHVKHSARFFDLGRPTRKTMLHPIGQLLDELSTTLPRGSLLYRARILGQRPSTGWSAQDELGPPPANGVRANPNSDQNGPV